MNPTLKDAIDKAVGDQYPIKPASSFQKNFQDNVRRSEKEKLTAMFDKRMIEAGFRIMPAGARYALQDHHAIFQEWRFWPERLFRFDRAWPGIKLAIEIEGGVWRKGGGAHSHPTSIMRDIEKYNGAMLLGWRILRFSDFHLKSPYCLECIQSVLKGHLPKGPTAQGG